MNTQWEDFVITPLQVHKLTSEEVEFLNDRGLRVDEIIREGGTE